jgi:glycosyltransferase involved in cell wall biosynthesis
MSQIAKTESVEHSIFLVSIVIPIFNERSTLVELVRRVQALPWPKELVLVDDGSNDGGVLQLSRPENVRVIVHARNKGKGAAVRTALEQVQGEIVVIQDADLEYDPADLTRLIARIVAGEADVVYGSRIREALPPSSWPHRLANQVLTCCSNRLTGLQLTDMETCYKVMRRDVVKSLKLREDRFGFEPEITAKIARGGWRVVESPVSYRPRTRHAGKKIGIRDGLRALWCILRYSRWD